MRGTMKLVDPYTGRMECKVCGEYHNASIRPMSGGKYYRGSWQCRFGCKSDKSADVTKSQCS